MKKVKVPWKIEGGIKKPDTSVANFHVVEDLEKECVIVIPDQSVKVKEEIDFRLVKKLLDYAKSKEWI